MRNKKHTQKTINKHIKQQKRSELKKNTKQIEIQQAHTISMRNQKHNNKTRTIPLTQTTN